MSSPLDDVFTEVVLFCMDRAVARRAKGVQLHRQHDDFWLWGPENECIKAWDAVTEFNRVMGLDINIGKSGSVVISQKKVDPVAVVPHKKPATGGENVPGATSCEDKESLSSGDVAWGFLVLDATTGRLK